MAKPTKKAAQSCGTRLPRSTDCGQSGNRTEHHSLKAIVRAYLKIRPGNNQRGLDYYIAAQSLSEAVERAALSQTKQGKRHPHQRRIPRRVLEKARAALLRANLKQVENFNDLHQRVQRAIGRIKGVGDLAVYDIAHRIGVFLGVHPEHVYLHCGTRDGAKALGLNYRAARLSLGDLPAPLRKLRPDQVEDCLCIFKDEF